MLHVVKQLQTRFPGSSARIAPKLLLASAVALLIGIVVFALR